MATSTDLGVEHEIELSAGRIRYRERGGAGGRPVVLVHGLLVNAHLWAGVVAALGAARGDEVRCLAPDWPMGAHTVGVPDMAMDLTSLADVVAEFLERLDLADVTLVGNDSGGALVQLVMVRAPHRVGRVVLTSCDAFERVVPWMFAPVAALGAVPAAARALAETVVRWPLLARSPFAFGWLSRHGLPPALLASFTASLRREPAVRADLARLLRALDRRALLAIDDGLARFDRPVLLAWAVPDRVFPISLAHRLAARLPDARIVGVEDSYTFVPVDQPARLAELISGFLPAPAHTPVDAHTAP